MIKIKLGILVFNKLIFTFYSLSYSSTQPWKAFVWEGDADEDMKTKIFPLKILLFFIMEFIIYHFHNKNRVASKNGKLVGNNITWGRHTGCLIFHVLRTCIARKGILYCSTIPQSSQKYTRYIIFYTLTLPSLLWLYQLQNKVTFIFIRVSSIIEHSYLT